MFHLPGSRGHPPGCVFTANAGGYSHTVFLFQGDIR